MVTTENLNGILNHFGLEGEYQPVPLGNGHINDTVLLTHATESPLVLQRINHGVFKYPEAIMRNLEVIRNHLATYQRGSRYQQQLLSYLKTSTGDNFLKSEEGDLWRLNPFIEGTRTVERADDPQIAHRAAAGFGRFMKDLSDLDPALLEITIPHFHDAALRFGQFKLAVKEDVQGRVAAAREVIDFAKANAMIVTEYVQLLQSGQVPLRITHNDTKINNILFGASGEVAGVIDLDTLMPGHVISDFGDMVRTFTPTEGEEATDLDQVGVRMEIFEALAGGYLEATLGLLTRIERDHLVFGGKLMTYVQGLRFLTDHLQGDRYYEKIKRPGQNLDRALNQFRLLQCIQDQEPQMQTIIRQFL